jgi:hypothetical protein
MRTLPKKELAQFLIHSTVKGYASGDNSREVKEADDGSTSITIENGFWKSHDNWFGGEPYGGRLIVSYKGNPVWIMVYYGQILETFRDTLGAYRFLSEALRLIPEDAPYRGPREYISGNWRYHNNWQGTIDGYSGVEYISFDHQQIYIAWYRGGIINVHDE